MIGGRDGASLNIIQEIVEANAVCHTLLCQEPKHATRGGCGADGGTGNGSARQVGQQPMRSIDDSR